MWKFWVVEVLQPFTHLEITVKYSLLLTTGREYGCGGTNIAQLNAARDHLLFPWMKVFCYPPLPKTALYYPSHAQLTSSIPPSKFLRVGAWTQSSTPPETSAWNQKPPEKEEL